MKDYYKVLDISKNATNGEIKKAYRSLALKFHPDKNSNENANAIFIELTEAYEVLSNENRRKHYDELLEFSENTKSFRYGEQTKNKWENDINNAKKRGRKKGEKFAKNFNYFSKSVIKKTALIVFVELIFATVFGIIFEDAPIFSWLLLALIMTIVGIVVFIMSWGNLGYMSLGCGLTFLGALWFRREVRRENES